MIYRQEHPKPQFMRDAWLNLNGEWQFEIDYSKSGKSRKLYEANSEFSKTIQVPFCPESKLSGVEHKDFMNSVWYKRSFHLEESQLENLVFVHFGAVDYEAYVYINGVLCGTHKGGYVSFSFDITEYVRAGENVITVQALDDTTNPFVPSGKQSDRYESYECFYTRTTGIWQTVWLEFVPKTHIVKTKYITDVENAGLHIEAQLSGAEVLKAEVFYRGKKMGEGSVKSNGGFAALDISLQEKHLWEVGNGRLYDLVLTYGEDIVHSYFGLRSIQLDGYKFLINGRSVFQRLILDQGFYPEGICTAPSDDELIADIERSLSMGFNGARLHQKVFEERFLYHCDRMGYLAWGEYPSWGVDHSCSESIYNVLNEWIEVLERDFNHPAIIGWCIFNETWDRNGRKQYDELISTMYRVTKTIDKTRPCIDASGAYHVLTDIFDVHDYEQKPEIFAEKYKSLPIDGSFYDRLEKRQQYQKGQPMYVSEYGGIAWAMDGSGWGYGNSPNSAEEYLERLKGLTDALLDNECMFGLCYTQLTDVEQEQNGLYTYDRKAKFDPKVIHAIFSREAAIEK